MFLFSVGGGQALKAGRQGVLLTRTQHYTALVVRRRPLKTVNFLAEYSYETVAKHVLSVETYGEGSLQEDGRWVLLELEASD